MRVQRSRKQPTPLEKIEQFGIVQLVGGALHGKAYVLGTRRGRNERDHGTHQTAGLADLWIVLPGLGMWWECKREGEQTSRTRDQLNFAEWCAVSNVAYGHGTLNDFIGDMLRRGRLKDGQVAHYRLPEAQG